MRIETFEVVKKAREYGCKAKTTKGILRFLRSKKYSFKPVSTKVGPATYYRAVEETPNKLIEDQKYKVSLDRRLGWKPFQHNELSEEAFRETAKHNRLRVYTRPSTKPSNLICVEDSVAGYYSGRYRGYKKMEYTGVYFSAVAISRDRKVLFYSSKNTDMQTKRIMACDNAVWLYEDGSVFIVSKDGTKDKLSSLELDNIKLTKSYLKIKLKSKRRELKEQKNETLL